MVQYATVKNPKTGERKKVTVGDPNAFAGGFELETRPPSQGAGDLSGTLQPQGDFQLPSQGNTMNQFTSLRNLIDSMTTKITQNRGSVQDVVSGLKEKLGGTGELSPAIAGAGIQSETQRFQQDVGTIFRNVMRQIDTMEKVKLTQQQNVNELMGNLASAGLLNTISGKEYETIMQTGVLPMETLQKISQAVQMKQAKSDAPSIEEQLSALEAGYNIEGGKLVKDVSGATVDQIADAIKMVESGGNYEAKGGSGEFGAYQFMPQTWYGWAREYQKATGEVPSGTPENQDNVAKFKINQWLQQGLNAEQIAAKWNSGSEVGWENKRGTNKFGIKYDVPAYVNKVKNALTKVMEQTPQNKFTEEFYSTDYGQKVLNNEQQYNTSFMGQQLTKDFINVQNKAESVRRIFDAGVGGPGDLAMVFEFMKALDPSSVVRESEYETASKSGNIFKGYLAKYNGYLKEEGGFLPDTVKKSFIDIVDKKLSVYQSQFDSLRNYYRKIAEEQGLNPEHVAPDMKINFSKKSSGTSGIKEKVRQLGYDYDKMVADGYSEEEIKEALNIQ